MSLSHPWARILAAFLVLAIIPADTDAQSTQGTRNVHLDGRVPVRALGTPVAVALDQTEPFVYVAHGASVSAIHVETRQKQDVWNPEIGTLNDVALVGPSAIAVAGEGGVAVGRWDDGKLSGQIIHSENAVRAVAGYQHSDGSGLVLAAHTGGVSLLSGDGNTLGLIALPEDVPGRDRGVHRAWAAYDLATESDRLYLAAAGGYFVFDVTQVQSPALLTWVNSAAVQDGMAVQATPDATHIVTTANYDSAPVRIFDLRPAMDGTITQVRTASGAWTADWRGHARQLEVRWPYVFVAAREHGLGVFNMYNTFEPYTTATFQTAQPGTELGAVDVDVRNSDGLIAVLDSDTGLWLLRLDDFRGWDGRGWGLGNISSVQDWASGPVGADQW